MHSTINPSALAQNHASNVQEFPKDLWAPVITAACCIAWLPVWFVVIWSAAYVAVLIANRRQIQRWVESKVYPSLAVIGCRNGVLALVYCALPWALIFQGTSSASIVAMVMFLAGSMRAVQAFTFGRWPGIVCILPYALPAIAPPLLKLLQQPTLGHGLALLSIIALFIYMVRNAVQQIGLRQSIESALEESNALRAQAQDKERLAEHLLRTPLISMAVFDKDGRFQAVSARFAERMSTTPEALIGRLPQEALPWAPPSWLDAWAQGNAGIRTQQDAVPYTGPDGVQAWSSWEVSPWYDESGQLAGVISYGLDVSAIVEAREKAETLTEHLNLALTAGNAAVMHLDLKAGRLVSSFQAEQVYGCQVTMADFDAMTSPYFLDEDRAAIAKTFLRALKGEVSTFEHRFIHAKTGEVRWVRPAFRLQRGDDGRAETFIIMATDITERRQREDAFAASLGQAENVLDRRRALLAKVSEVLELPTPVMGEAGAALQVPSTEDGFETMAARLSRLMNEIGMRDAALMDMVTALNDSRQQAEASNTAKSQFLANMSHELRTPLNAIIGYSEILMEGAENEAREADVADHKRVLSASKRLLNLINEVLDLSKIEAGRMELEIEPFDMAAMIQSAAETLRPAAAANGNELIVRIADDLPLAVGDGFRLSQCVLNLLSNAVKFTRLGRVSVSVRSALLCEGQTFIIEVSDTGVGIPLEAQAKIFTPFTQADSSTTRAFGGTGLGLTITRHFIQLMGGHIALRSAPGEGSTFTLHIPVASTEARALPAADTTDAAASGPIVLVVDKDPNAHDLARRALNRLGFNVQTAATAHAARTLLSTLTPDLVVMDVALGADDREGEALLAELGTTCAAPTLVVSVRDDAARFKDLGACASLVKPVGRERLCAAVLQYICHGDQDAPDDLTIFEAAPLSQPKTAVKA